MKEEIGLFRSPSLEMPSLSLDCDHDIGANRPDKRANLPITASLAKAASVAIQAPTNSAWILRCKNLMDAARYIAESTENVFLNANPGPYRLNVQSRTPGS